MSLFEILACPVCRVSVKRTNNLLECNQCGRTFPIVNGIPVMFPDGSIPEIQHEAELVLREGYDPWVHRTVLQSLLDDQIVVDIGAGNMALDDPCIIRMDVTLSPYVDLVADAHALPFLPESVDFIFSLAVGEHLRNPFQAAQSIYEVLKNGGYIYHESNFVFSYHGYPHHYFNATLQGMEQVFSQFRHLRKGVAPYQMPSFAIDNVLRAYLNYSHADEFEHGRLLTPLLRQIIEMNLMDYDIYFNEEEALNMAAGVYILGMKQVSATSTLIPPIIESVWKENDDLQARYPDLSHLTPVDNILIWAKSEGRENYPEIEKFLNSVIPFNKKGKNTEWNREKLRTLPLLESKFGAIGFNPALPMEVNAKSLEAISPQERIYAQALNLSMLKRGVSVLMHEGFRPFLRKLLRYFDRLLLE